MPALVSRPQRQLTGMRGWGPQLTSAQRAGLHAVFVAVGGGGLIAGIAAYVKALHPDVKIIGVEPSGAPACHRITHMCKVMSGRQ